MIYSGIAGRHDLEQKATSAKMNSKQSREQDNRSRLVFISFVSNIYTVKGALAIHIQKQMAQSCEIAICALQYTTPIPPIREKRLTKEGVSQSDTDSLGPRIEKLATAR